MFSAGGRRFVWNLFIVVIIFCIIIIIYTPQRRISSLPKQVKGWEVNVTRETRIYVVPENDTSVISGKEICKDTLDVIVIVHSAPDHFAERSAIRESWGSYNVTSIKVAFLLGTSKNVSSQVSVEEESVEYQDIIQEDFIDSYNNLTVKSVMMLKWFLNKCPSPKFLLKTDDDMFLNTEFLSKLLSNMSNNSVLIGSLICRAKRISDTRSKWYLPKYMYHKVFYPNYLSGTAYLMSRDVAVKLYQAALSTTLIHLEDVFITGICAAKAGITPRNHAAFSYLNFGVTCHPSIMTNHRLTPDQIRYIWNHANNCTISYNLRPPTSSPKNKSQCH